MIHYVHAGWLALAMSPCYGMTETKWHLAKKSAMALIVFAVRVFSSNSTFWCSFYDFSDSIDNFITKSEVVCQNSHGHLLDFPVSLVQWRVNTTR